jgi:hypothetical protein
MSARAALARCGLCPGLGQGSRTVSVPRSGADTECGASPPELVIQPAGPVVRRLRGFGRPRSSFSTLLLKSLDGQSARSEACARFWHEPSPLSNPKTARGRAISLKFYSCRVEPRAGFHHLGMAHDRYEDIDGVAHAVGVPLGVDIGTGLD